MASKRISELPAATALDGSEQIPLTQAGETRRIGSDTLLRSILADPRDHGGVGDGVANDTAAIHEAVKTGKPVWLPPGTWNVDTTFDNELDAPSMADFVFFGAGRSRSVLQWVGLNTGTAFHFASHVNADDPRVAMVDIGAKTDAARGHTSRTVDTFTTISTADAGTQSEAIFVHLDTAGGEVTTFERCRFTDFGEAIQAGGNPTYALEVTSTQIQWCNIGVNLQGMVTTSRIADSCVISRNAIGVRLRMCQQVEIADNVIQGNYAGCDIFDYQANEYINVAGNYFEASPDVYWHQGDSGLDSQDVHLHFERNFGLAVHLSDYVSKVTLKDNRLIELFHEYAFNDGPREVVCENNHKADDTPFGPADVTGTDAGEVEFMEYRWHLPAWLPPRAFTATRGTAGVTHGTYDPPSPSEDLIRAALLLNNDGVQRRASAEVYIPLEIPGQWRLAIHWVNPTTNTGDAQMIAVMSEPAANAAGEHMGNDDAAVTILNTTVTDPGQHVRQVSLSDPRSETGIRHISFGPGGLATIAANMAVLHVAVVPA